MKIWIQLLTTIFIQILREFSAQNAFFDYKDYNILTIVGNGRYSIIFLVERKLDHIQDALKKFKYMKLMIELSIYQKVNHSAIIKFYGANFVSLTDPTRFSPSIIQNQLFSDYRMHFLILFLMIWNLIRKISMELHFTWH